MGFLNKYRATDTGAAQTTKETPANKYGRSSGVPRTFSMDEDYLDISSDSGSIGVPVRPRTGRRLTSSNTIHSGVAMDERSVNQGNSEQTLTNARDSGHFRAAEKVDIGSSGELQRPKIPFPPSGFQHTPRPNVLGAPLREQSNPGPRTTQICSLRQDAPWKSPGEDDEGQESSVAPVRSVAESLDTDGGAWGGRESLGSTSSSPVSWESKIEEGGLPGRRAGYQSGEPEQVEATAGTNVKSGWQDKGIEPERGSTGRSEGVGPKGGTHVDFEDHGRRSDTLSDSDYDQEYMDDSYCDLEGDDGCLDGDSKGRDVDEHGDVGDDDHDDYSDDLFEESEESVEERQDDLIPGDEVGETQRSQTESDGALSSTDDTRAVMPEDANSLLAQLIQDEKPESAVASEEPPWPQVDVAGGQQQLEVDRRPRHAWEKAGDQEESKVGEEQASSCGSLTPSVDTASTPPARIAQATRSVQPEGFPRPELTPGRVSQAWATNPHQELIERRHDAVVAATGKGNNQGRREGSRSGRLQSSGNIIRADGSRTSGDSSNNTIRRRVVIDRSCEIACPEQPPDSELAAITRTDTLARIEYTRDPERGVYFRSFGTQVISGAAATRECSRTQSVSCRPSKANMLVRVILLLARPSSSWSRGALWT